MKHYKNNALKCHITLFKVFGYLLFSILFANPVLAYGELIQHNPDGSSGKAYDYTNSYWQYHYGQTFTPSDEWDVTSWGISIGYASGGGQPSDNFIADLCTWDSTAGSYDDPCLSVLDTMTVSGSSVSSVPSWHDETYSGTLSSGQKYFIRLNRTSDGLGSPRFTIGYSADNDDGAGGSGSVAEGNEDFGGQYRSGGNDIWDWNGVSKNMAYRISGSVAVTWPNTFSEVTTTSATGTDVIVNGTCRLLDSEKQEGAYYVAQDSSPAVPGTSGVTDWSTKVSPEVFVHAFRTDSGQEGFVYAQGVSCDETTGDWTYTFNDLAQGTWEFHVTDCQKLGSGVQRCTEDWRSLTHYATGGTVGDGISGNENVDFGDAAGSGVCDESGDDGFLTSKFCWFYDGVTSRPPMLWLGQLKQAYEDGWNGTGESVSLSITTSDLGTIDFFDSASSTMGIGGTLNDVTGGNWLTWMSWIIWGSAIAYAITVPSRFLSALNPKSQSDVHPV